MIISLLQTIAKPLFGNFEREEFKKFLRMGVIFAFIIGSYWTLRPLKKAIFYGLVGAGNWEAWAKTASLLLLIPIVMIYTKLLDRYSREKMFYILATTYGIITVLFAILLTSATFGQASDAVIATRTGFAKGFTMVLGFLWYVFVESYGSLIVALFWAIASDITSPDSAKKGFSLVVAIGQMGGIVGPWAITQLPEYFGFESDALSVAACSLLTFSLIFLFSYFLRATPANLMISFHGKNEKEAEKEQEPGFFEGLKLMLQHKYLMGIFSILFFFEFIVTIFDLHFGLLAKQTYSGQALSKFLASYASSVNTVALVCLLLGVSNITRIFGVTVSLALLPIIFTGAITGFLTLNSLTFLFWLMVGSKAINYALNGPAVKQLYIPTTHDVKFKSQAWIETFGSRASKESGAVVMLGLQPLVTRLGAVAGRARHILYSSIVSYILVGIWFFVALYLGRTHKKAIDENRVVC